ncbi:MAG TPA: methyltransferase domain-containing protein [Terriglobia bacterium]|nr:methyltransferase domain-containing protein [Terriglobia bacterium]
MSTQAAGQQLREEFNRWAEAGRGEGMETDHLPIVLPMLAMINLRPDEVILDAGCGTGWLCRLLSKRVTHGKVMGMDVSDEMVRRAQRASAGVANVSFITGSVDGIPQPAESFNRVVSVESAYYWPQPEDGLREILRVLKPGGSAWVLINYYRDNLYCHQWAQHYTIPTHLLSADEWAGLFREVGFSGVEDRRIPDPTPTPATYTGRWFRDAEELRRFREEGALLVYGTKPAPPPA